MNEFSNKITPGLSEKGYRLTSRRELARALRAE